MKKLKNLDGLKGLWILTIVICHYMLDFGNFYGVAVPQFLYNGHFAACGFFILSGFLICLRHKEDYRKAKFPASCLTSWFWNFRRLFVFNLIGTIPFAVKFIMEKGFTVKSAGIIGLNLLMLQNWIQWKNYSLNTVCWFLSVLMFCYLLAPVFFRIYGKLYEKFGVAVSVLLLLFGSAYLFVMMKTDWNYKNVLFHPMMFMMGAAAADIVKKCFAESKYTLWPAAMILFAAGYLIPAGGISYLIDTWTAVLLICVLYLSKEMVVFSGQVICRLGKSSLAVMVIHTVPLLLTGNLLVSYCTGNPLGGALLLAGFAILSIGISIILYAAEQGVRRKIREKAIKTPAD